MTDQYAVLGNPIAHSKSPDIHQRFAELTGQSLSYSKHCLAQFSDVATLIDQGYRGFNVTVPFKLDAFAYVDARSDRAETAQAVNTIVVQADGRLLGDNTDGIGLVTDLLRTTTLRGKRVAVLGAGGAVRGVLGPLLDQAPSEVVIANRTASKATDLAAAFAARGQISGAGFEGLAGEFDVIINGTAASLSAQLPPLPAGVVTADSICYDMMYGAEPTVFMRWATEQGAAHSLDGLGMLVGQAAESFFLWRGVRPPVEPVIDALRSAL